MRSVKQGKTNRDIDQLTTKYKYWTICGQFHKPLSPDMPANWPYIKTKEAYKTKEAKKLLTNIHFAICHGLLESNVLLPNSRLQTVVMELRVTKR